MKTNIVILTLLLTAVLSVNSAWAAMPLIENVSFVQETDGSGQVVINYDLFDADGDAVTITLRASGDGGLTWDLICDTVSGDAGSGVLSGTGKTIVWYFGVDYPNFFSDQVMVRVMADDGVPSSGPFANYIAIGNSLTSGYMDGGLHIAGQTTSYPQLIADALGYQADSFSQPMVASPGIGSSAAPPGYVAGVFYFNGSGIGLLGLTPIVEVPSLLLNVTWPVPYSNLGVPGATTSDVLNCTSSANSQVPGNPYFDIILRNSYFDDLTMTEQAISRGPTLVTCWIGNNDILNGATSGEPMVGVNITPTAEFSVMFETILDRTAEQVMTEFGWAPVMITANIPSISNVPYFIPVELFEVMIGSPYPYEENPVYVLFPALSYVAGGQPPLPSYLTLDEGEVAVIEGMIAEYNAVIASASAQRSIMLYDVHLEMAEFSPSQKAHLFTLLGSGMDMVTAAETTEFSLDGIHPNNHGYANLAQGFLNQINSEFGTSFEVPTDLVWDPTYGVPVTEMDSPQVTSEAAQAMTNLFNKIE
jgi:hypothetical protein